MTDIDRRGPPTREELQTFYKPKFTWEQLKLFINSGDLGLLKRDKELQKRYMNWSAGIKAEYGSIESYLLNYRLQWGRPDNISLLKSKLNDVAIPTSEENEKNMVDDPLPPYFTANSPPSLISIIQNDWPYSIPLEVEHTLIWTKLPILPEPTLLKPHIAETLSPDTRNVVMNRLRQDGLWGFTGTLTPPPSPSTLPESIGALKDWGLTLDKLIVSPKGTIEEEEAIKLSGEEVHKFVKRRWLEREWETCWFVNPPRLQSVKGLAHAHIFARKKSLDEITEWDKESDRL